MRGCVMARWRSPPAMRAFSTARRQGVRWSRCAALDQRSTHSPGGRTVRYRAFLSYSHNDAAWARWLLRKLEGYRVPARLVGTPGRDGPIPARLGAMFRDRDE